MHKLLRHFLKSHKSFPKWIICLLLIRRLRRLLSFEFFVYKTQCLKITEKVAFKIASEASYVYILGGQKFIKNAKNGPIWRVVEYLKLLVKQCYQKGLIELDKNWWKMPKLKYSNATFWVIFKHCDTFFQYILNTVSYSCLKPRSFKITETSIIQ